MTLPENALSLEEAAARLGVAPHVILFWQKRCGGFRLLTERDGGQFVRRGDMSLLFAIQRMIVGESVGPDEVGEIIRRRSPSVIINDGDRRAARAALAGAPDGSREEDAFIDSRDPAPAGMLKPSSEQAAALRQLAAAAGALDSLRHDLAGLEKRLGDGAPDKESDKETV